MRNGKIPTVTIEQAQKNYTKVRISVHVLKMFSQVFDLKDS